MRKIYSCIDIGSSSIKILVVEKSQNGLVVLAREKYSSSGVSKGFIMNEKDFSLSLKKALKEFLRVYGLKIDKALITVGLNDVKVKVVDALVKIISEDKIISGSDITRLNNKIKEEAVDIKDELIFINNSNYIIDDTIRVRNPKGRQGTNLKVEAMIASTPKKFLFPIFNALNSAGVDVVDVCYNSVGDYYNIDAKEIDRYKGFFVNIGAETTTVTYFDKANLIASDVIKIGSSIIENEIANIYNISLDKAILLKEKFATISTRFAREVVKVSLKTKDNGLIELNQLDISKIMEIKFIELLKLIKNSINNLTKDKISYIIMTGGITESEGFDYILDNTFGIISKRLVMNEIGIRNNIYSSAFGSLKYYDEKLSFKDRDYSMISEEDLKEFLKKPYKNNKINIDEILS